MSEELKAALARIACLEGEIAKRDETIVNAAPVSEAKAQGVVMPEPCTDCNGLGFGAFGCCGECCGSGHKRVAPVQQVSVPDGWRELAKRADDFLYSLPETDGVLRLRADLCTMLAAPAAPAADAYSWRRKEGVNGIKEFMAQKCYDAQTDAIKKYYEPFKCANCKAADAGLVEALEKLARLGNGDKHGNSDGNLIARAALAAHSAKGVV